jgi:hypothetical protein
MQARPTPSYPDGSRCAIPVARCARELAQEAPIPLQIGAYIPLEDFRGKTAPAVA